MKTIIFSDKKRKLIVFEAQEVNIIPQEEVSTFILTANGSVESQETPSVEEMAAGDYPCLMSVSENGVESLHTPCMVTLISFAPDQLIARVMMTH